MFMCCLCVPALQPARAQESIRPSLAGDTVASLSRPTIDSSNYNLKLGPALVSLSSGLQLEFNDNVTLSENHREGDLIIRPSINASAVWQVTELNALRLDLGIGYAKYVDHSEFDTGNLLIAPNSNLSFDIYVGDFRITLFDQFSIQQNPVDEITLSRVGKFERFQNAAGLTVTWDLNAVILVSGYTNYLFRSLDSEFQFLDRTEQQFFTAAAVRLNDATKVGVRGTGGIVTYDQAFQNDGFIYSFGPFVEAQLTPYMRVELEGGYQGGNFETGGLNGDKSNLSGFYGRLLLSHRLNRYWTDGVSIGHEATIGLTTNTTTLTYVRYNADWRVNSRTNLNLAAFYEHGNDSPGVFESENIDRIGFSVSLGYTIGRHTVTSLAYQYLNRASDLADRSYRQNQLLWSISYAF
jgi:Outer membrane protein/protective antigen OMA87